GELVVTSNGKPIAVLSGTSDDTLDRTIAALRRARAQVAVTRLRASAQERGVDRMAAKDIQAEIRSARRRRRRRPR
ncbi:MAG: prevent-host-death protein, partial [Planctomycetota bacterium]